MFTTTISCGSIKNYCGKHSLALSQSIMYYSWIIFGSVATSKKFVSSQSFRCIKQTTFLEIEI